MLSGGFTACFTVVCLKLRYEASIVCSNKPNSCKDSSRFLGKVRTHTWILGDIASMSNRGVGPSQGFLSGHKVSHAPQQWSCWLMRVGIEPTP